MLRFVRRRRHDTDGRGVPTLMIGAGPPGRALAHRLLSGSGNLLPIGFIDAELSCPTVAGLPLLGHPDELAEIVMRTGARAAVLAVPALPKERVAELVGRGWGARLDLRWLPDCPEHGGAGARVEDLRELRLSRLIGRDEVEVAGAPARRLVEGRRVLVTGSAGPIGTALRAALGAASPAGLWPVEEDLGDETAVRTLLADLRPEMVFHAAGDLGLEALERDPCSAVRANVLATHRLVDEAVRQGVERFVLVSTDKAADPASVLGATRRLAEVVTQIAAGGPTRFATVRLGNLLGTPGSLLSVLATRIPRGEAVMVAHPEVARHFMTVGEAAGLVLAAAALAQEAETFALDMGDPVPVVDLVYRYAEMLCLPEVTIRFSGLGPGERLAERPFSASERRVRTAHPRIWATRPAPPPPGLLPLLNAIYEAAGRGDEDRVRLLLRRLLPEYRPVRRPARMIMHDQRDSAGDAMADHESL